VGSFGRWVGVERVVARRRQHRLQQRRRSRCVIDHRASVEAGVTAVGDDVLGSTVSCFFSSRADMPYPTVRRAPVLTLAVAAARCL